MPTVKLICPQCKKVAVASYRADYGHGATDEALAIKRAIENHKCDKPKEVKNE